jgi:hypothetical protein
MKRENVRESKREENKPAGSGCARYNPKLSTRRATTDREPAPPSVASMRRTRLSSIFIAFRDPREVGSFMLRELLNISHARTVCVCGLFDTLLV